MRMGGICLNWKVIAGLVVVGLGVWAAAPNLVGAVLPLLLVLACPLSMFLMMRGMGGMRGGQCAAEPARPEQASQPARAGLTREEQLAALKAQLIDLQAQHEVIAREIARREATELPPSSVVREAEATARAADRRAQGQA